MTAIQVIVNPLVSWIWAGGVVMSIGAVLCLLPRLIPQPLPAVVPAKASQRHRLPATASA